MSEEQRAARPDEAGTLSELILRSKAYWGYDEAFLAGCREDLRLRSGDVVARRTVVAERDGRVLGVATLDGDPPHGELGLLFVEPDAIGGGVGRTLYHHLQEQTNQQNNTQLTIESDPNAEAFYLAMGADRVRQAPLPGRGAGPGRPGPPG